MSPWELVPGRGFPKLWVVQGDLWRPTSLLNPTPIEHPVCFVRIPEKLPPKNIFCNITVLSYCTPPPPLLAGTLCTIGGPALGWSTCQPLTPDTPWHPLTHQVDSDWLISSQGTFHTLPLPPKRDIFIMISVGCHNTPAQDSCDLSPKCQLHFWCYF